jgi:hypothetical protein
MDQANIRPYPLWLDNHWRQARVSPVGITGSFYDWQPNTIHSKAVATARSSIVWFTRVSGLNRCLLLTVIVIDCYSALTVRVRAPFSMFHLCSCCNCLIHSHRSNHIQHWNWDSLLSSSASWMSDLKWELSSSDCSCIGYSFHRLS